LSQYECSPSLIAEKIAIIDNVFVEQLEELSIFNIFFNKDSYEVYF